MSNTIFITANWTTGALSQQTISRQYDNNRYAVQFIGYPEGDGTEELDLYLLVWMSTAPGQKPGEITPIQLNSDQWYISNYFTQQVQVIKFQLCVLNEAGTYEAHSPIFSGRIGDSLEHDGTSHDIDVSTLFDAYREYLNELIIGAGAVIIDPVPTQGSTNAVQSGGVYEALQSAGLSEDAKVALLACFEHVAWTDEHGQDYYNRLRDALTFDVISITASFNQGGNVFTHTDELDDLRPFLTVTGTTGDGSEELRDYTLSGNLNTEVSTITVRYADLITSFNVSVSMLPSGYTLKNYVQANGTQYVASGVYEIDMDGKWTRCKVNVPQMSDSRTGHILSATNEYSPYLRNDGNSRFMSYNRFGSQNATYASDVQKWEFNEDTIIESYKEENKIYTNGVHQYTVTPGTTKSSQNQMYFFTYGGNVTATQYRFYGKLYYFKIYNPNGAKVHDFIPCKNASNVAGLYDLVSGTFHAPVSGTLVTD